MEKTPPSRIHEIFFASSDRGQSRRMAALLKEGVIRKIAPRTYSSNLSEAPAEIIKRNWYRVLANLYPEALLSHRTALESKPTKEGHVYLTYIYTRNVQIPGLTIHFLYGPGRIEGDHPFFEGLYISHEARAFLENLQTTRSTAEEAKTLPPYQLEERLESIIRARGEQALNVIRDRAKAIAPDLGMEKEFRKLNNLISDLLVTGKSKNSKSPAGISRALGEPLDGDRIRLFESLYEELAGKSFLSTKTKTLLRRPIRHSHFSKATFQII